MVGFPPGIGVTFRLGGVPEGGRRCHLQRYFPRSMLRTFGCSLVPHRHSIRIRFSTPADPRCRQASACWRRRSPPNPEGITGSLAFSAMPAIIAHPGSIISRPTQSNLTRCSKAADSQTDDDQCPGVAVSIILKTSELRLKAEYPGASAFRLSDRAVASDAGRGRRFGFSPGLAGSQHRGNITYGIARNQSGERRDAGHPRRWPPMKR